MKLNNGTRLTEAEELAVVNGFASYNAAQGYDSIRQPLALTVYDNEGVLVGVLDGYMFFDWLTVGRLWVRDDMRGSGIGSQLLVAAENQAKLSGCVGSTLSTYEFQAEPFYAKHGYEVFGTLENNPRGCVRHFMRKLFKEAS